MKTSFKLFIQELRQYSTFQQSRQGVDYLKGVPRTEHKLSEGSLDPKRINIKLTYI